MEQNRKEAIDNLRVAIKTTLLVLPQHEYRKWAQLYLKQSEPRLEGLDVLRDMASDSIEHLAGWEPWDGPGRARDCWYAIKIIAEALWHFEEERYHNATMEALRAANIALVTAKRCKGLAVCHVQDLERSLYGESFTN